MGLYSKIVDGFKKAFEIKCVTLLVSAYHTSIVDHIYSPGWMENDFTSMLDEYIDKNPQRVKWKISCNVEHHLHKKGLKKKKGYANSEDRIDLRFTTFSSKDEYCFFVEAKRLKEKDSGLLNRYINTGIDHYLSKKYPHGVLLGYMIEGNVDTTIQKINALLTKKKRESEMLKRQSHSLHDQYFESTHPNFGVISHFVFDYTV
jgi:hypothetical protein